MKKNIKITLASTSPRKKEMLAWLGLDFEAVDPSFDESFIRHKNPKKLTQLLAQAKAEAIKKDVNNGIVIGSDSVVSFKNQIFEKAKNKNHQRELIKAQRGQKAATVSSVCVINLTTGKKIIRTKITEYVIADVTDEQIEVYIESGQGLDKAGGFGLQDAKGMFVKEILGCYPNVIGFPICEVSEVLKDFGVQIDADVKNIVQEKVGYEC